MIVFRDPAEVPAGFGPSVVAIGKFDGVHAGHRAVLERAKVDAAADAKVVAVTFDRNPLSLLRPELCPEDLIGVTQKLQLLAGTGIDATLMLRFDEALASLTPREFVERILVDALGARTVLVGTDFRFGRGGAGNPEVLQELGGELGFRVDVIGDVRSLESDRRVSSTWIRELLAQGDVEAAARLLGRPHAVWGEVVHGAKRGRELGFPTANLSSELEGFIPADGVYAGWLVDEGRADARTAPRGGPAHHAVSGRDQRRLQPDVRRRHEPPGRGVRPRRDRSRPLRTTGRGAVRDAGARHGRVRRHRCAHRADVRRRREGAHAPRVTRPRP